MGRTCSTMGESRNAYRVLVGRPEGKRPLERPRRRWEDNIKMDLREVGYDGRDWINLAQDRDQWRAYTGRSFQTRYKEHITAITKLQNTSTYAEHITNANHTYRDINTDMEILHIQPKSQKLNTLEQYEIYRHTKTHPNDILNTQLNFKTHTLFDSTLRTHPHRKQEAPRPTTTSSEDDPKGSQPKQKVYCNEIILETLRRLWDEGNVRKWVENNWFLYA
ncbi:hypothetical protein ANN_27377 [Periplaneta americana]|uniref:Uncharacterized protein n=1 Tax=Periplaneta americana TaxID=6978 RepID=A0ABQ8RVK9_PERAM|nr:hypothetical protein ANN_27377 [Periplaneta americana]